MKEKMVRQRGWIISPSAVIKWKDAMFEFTLQSPVPSVFHQRGRKDMRNAHEQTQVHFSQTSTTQLQS